MNLLTTDYINQLIEKSKCLLDKSYNLSSFYFTDFDLINSFLIEKTLSNNNKTNLLLTFPDKDLINKTILPSIIIPSLNCLIKNSQCAEHNLKPNDTILNRNDGKISNIREVNNSLIKIHTRIPFGPIQPLRVELLNKEFVKLNISFDELCEVISEGNPKLFMNRLLEKYRISESILSLYKSKQEIPSQYKSKVVIVAQKNDVLTSIPSYIPYVYLKRKGEPDQYYKTFLDPLLIVVNDFGVVRENILDKGISIDTIIFISDNKYSQSISAISKAFRQGKFNHCIFLGTEDIESGENFAVSKWNWTLPEIKYFTKQSYQNIQSINLLNPELTSAINDYSKFITDTELQYNNLVNLKKLYKFIRKVFPITALNNEQRIRKRANEVYAEFILGAEEIINNEYYNIDKDYEEDLEKLKHLYQKILLVIKNSNTKAKHLETLSNIDFIVIPKVIKGHLQKELTSFLSRTTEVRVTNLSDISAALNKQHQEINQRNIGLRNIKVLSFKEFLNEKQDSKVYLFFSLYGNGVSAEQLLQKVLLSNLHSKILLYEEEEKAFKYYLQKFQQSYLLEFSSKDRESLSEIHYPEVPNITPENIDAWLKYLIELEDSRFSKDDEIKFEIVFQEESKPIKERKSKAVYVEGYEENYKEVWELKRGDKVRIYRPPDNETLHDLIAVMDETKFFHRVNEYSKKWKQPLMEFYQTRFYGNNLEGLHQELIRNSCTVDKVTLRNWLNPDNKTKFPKRKRDIAAILKTISKPELLTDILKIMKEYYGELPKQGNKLSDEVDNYLITKEIGTMLNWLQPDEIENLINNFAPIRTIKEIKKVDYEEGTTTSQIDIDALLKELNLK
ncbi:MAG: hypothetical protein STSR0008_21080 [Ignavibacterium sp.]